MSAVKSDSGGKFSKSIHGSYSFVYEQEPHKGDSSNLDLLPNTRWWLKNCGIGRDYLHERAQVSEAEVKLPEPSCGDANAKEFESKIDDDLLSNAHVMELESCNHLLFEQPKKPSSELDSQWTEFKKPEPWWQAADKNDLVSLASQEPFHHISNCSCQGVQSLHDEKASDDPENRFDHCNAQMIDKERNVLNVVGCEGNFTSASTDKSQAKQGLMELIMEESDRTFSNRVSSSEAKVSSPNTQDPTSSDLSRTQLLEALCHSQTRAREAEKFAQEACDEKDHIINLFFRQTSHLFAYRQWLNLLQLETLCLHLRSKDPHASFSTSSVSCKGMTLRKSRGRKANRKPSKQRCCICNRGIAFAVRLILAGAGLLVGWTIGWLFPAHM